MEVHCYLSDLMLVRSKPDLLRNFMSYLSLAMFALG